MARIKPNPVIIADLKQTEGALAEIAAIEREVSAIESEMQEAIDKAKTTASQKSEALLARKKTLSDAIGVYATLNRQELFAKAKSLDLGIGVIDFRASASVVQIRGITAKMTLEKLRQYNLTDGIRIKEEVNKEAALGWPDERLELVGLKRQTKDAFFIEINKDKVEKA